MIDTQPMTAVAYRKLLAERGWTHLVAAALLGIGERTSKVYAAQGAPAGLASLALRTLAQSEGGSTITASGVDPVAVRHVERRLARIEKQLRDVTRDVAAMRAALRETG